MVSQWWTPLRHPGFQLPGSGVGSGFAGPGQGGGRPGARDGRDPPWGTRLAHQHPLSPPVPPPLGALGKQTPGGLGHGHFCKCGLTARHPSPGSRNPPKWRGRSSAPPWAAAAWPDSPWWAPAIVSARESPSHRV